MEAVRETLNLIVEDIGGNPTKFIVELVQFAILFAGFWALAVGFGKRKGILVNAVDGRVQQTKADLALVESAPSILESARADSERIRAEARTEADGLLREATMEADALRREAKQSADDESSAILERADIALQTEEAEMQAEIRDLLVNVVADSTRSVMNEQLSLPEQRELIQSAILTSVGKGSSTPRSRPSSKKTQVAKAQSEVS